MEIFEFLKTVYDESIRLLENVRFDKTHLWHLYLVALYCTLIEFTGSIITLIESNKRTGVPALFRSMLEAYVVEEPIACPVSPPIIQLRQEPGFAF